MSKKYSKFVLTLLIFSFLMSLVACGGSSGGGSGTNYEPMLTGAWRQSTENGIDVSSENIVAVFGNSVLMVRSVVCDVNGEYAGPGNQLTINITSAAGINCPPVGQETMQYSISGDQLTVTDKDGEVEVFVKISTVSKLGENGGLLYGTWTLSSMNGQDASAMNTTLVLNTLDYTMTSPDCTEGGEWWYSDSAATLTTRVDTASGTGCDVVGAETTSDYGVSNTELLLITPPPDNSALVFSRQ